MKTITLKRPMLVDEIAREYLGHERHFRQIISANLKLLKMPLWIPDGTEILIPEQSEEAPAKRVRLFN